MSGGRKGQIFLLLPFGLKVKPNTIRRAVTGSSDVLYFPLLNATAEAQIWIREVVLGLEEDREVVHTFPL